MGECMWVTEVTVARRLPVSMSMCTYPPSKVPHLINFSILSSRNLQGLHWCLNVFFSSICAVVHKIPSTDGSCSIFFSLDNCLALATNADLSHLSGSWIQISGSAMELPCNRLSKPDYRINRVDFLVQGTSKISPPMKKVTLRLFSPTLCWCKFQDKFLDMILLAHKSVDTWNNQVGLLSVMNSSMNTHPLSSLRSTVQKGWAYLCEIVAHATSNYVAYTRCR